MDPKMRKIVSKALNANYHIGALSLYLMKSSRRQDSPMSKKVEKETGEKRSVPGMLGEGMWGKPLPR